MGKSKHDYIGCFAGEWFSHRRTKQHLLDELRMQLILLIDLPRLSNDMDCDVCITHFTNIMRCARKTKKRKLHRLIKATNQFYHETVERYNTLRQSDNKEEQCGSIVYRTIGTDIPPKGVEDTTLWAKSTGGVKLGVIAKFWREFADATPITNDERRVITPYNKPYWYAILNTYLYARYSGNREGLTFVEIIERAARECVDEDNALFLNAYAPNQTNIQNKETVNG